MIRLISIKTNQLIVGPKLQIGNWLGVIGRAFQFSLVMAVWLTAFVNGAAGADERSWHLGPCSTGDAFLSKIMHAESRGRLLAKNPRSSALGPFQFIKSTFLAVTRRHFAEEVRGMTEAQVLELRKSLSFARRVADAYAREIAAYFVRKGIAANPTNLRLAFFAGPSAAARVLTAKASTPMSKLISSAALQANPFLRRMTAGGLVRKSGREAASSPGLLDPYPVNLASARQDKARVAKSERAKRVRRAIIVERVARRETSRRAAPAAGVGRAERGKEPVGRTKHLGSAVRSKLARLGDQAGQAKRSEHGARTEQGGRTRPAARTGRAARSKAVEPAKGTPQLAKIKIRCNLARASCRKWLALRRKRLARERARQTRAEATADRRN